MSVINKKPFIQDVIETLNDEQLETLASLLNGNGGMIFRSFINKDAPFSEDDMGIQRCTFESGDGIFTGYLIYNSTYCVLVAYGNAENQNLKIIQIDYEHLKYKVINEPLSITELRELSANSIIVVEKSALYSHHFALIFVNDPIFGTFGVDMNIISNNATPYEKLSDVEGDGYIMSAFGSVGTSYFVDLRLIHQGVCYMYMTKLEDGSMSGYYVENMGDYEVNDSVQKI